MDTHDAARPSLDPAQPDPDAALRERARSALRALTGAPSADFHPGQFEAIRALVADRARALVVQRTGWGKSAVYFLSALLLRQEGGGPALIISPLLALMRDQVAAAEVAAVARADHACNATEPILEEGKRVDLDDVETVGDGPDTRGGPEVVRNLHVECVGQRMGLIDRGEQHTLAGARPRDGCGARERGLAGAALADEEFDPRPLRCGRAAQPSTLFFSSFNAVSVMTFSALRLNMPIIGMVRSTVSS